MSAIEEFLNQAWDEHADQPEAVAARLNEGLALVETDDQVARLAMLGHHVMGEHLNQWREGAAFLDRLAERGVHGAAGAAALARCRASLGLCADAGHDLAHLSASDRCRVTAMAAANLAVAEPARGAALLEVAVRQAVALPDADPAVRTLAATGNNMAVALQEPGPRSPEQRALMLRAAQVARAAWERAGGWREVERAEYRLAHCWLAAADPKQSLHHAQACEAIVRRNGSEPLEAFFAAEVLALATHALGDETGRAGAVATAQAAFDALPVEDQAWCRATLEQLPRPGLQPPPDFPAVAA